MSDTALGHAKQSQNYFEVCSVAFIFILCSKICRNVTKRILCFFELKSNIATVTNSLKCKSFGK